jgi:hypothetical protein
MPEKGQSFGLLLRHQLISRIKYLEKKQRALRAIMILILKAGGLAGIGSPWPLWAQVPVLMILKMYNALLSIPRLSATVPCNKRWAEPTGLAVHIKSVTTNSSKQTRE